MWPKKPNQWYIDRKVEERNIQTIFKNVHQYTENNILINYDNNEMPF